MAETLEFEEPIAVFLKEIDALAAMPRTDARDREIDGLRRRIESVRVIAQDTTNIVEPTHLTLGPNGDLLFIANGGFGAYEGNGQLRLGARQMPPRVGRVRRTLIEQ